VQKRSIKHKQASITKLKQFLTNTKSEVSSRYLDQSSDYDEQIDIELPKVNYMTFQARGAQEETDLLVDQEEGTIMRPNVNH
jgi:biotin-(acetyl-CoA carboxylase) ligase